MAEAAFPEDRPAWRPLALALLAPALMWTLLFVLIPPGRQDFPLNDDWAFGRGAFTFLRGEGIDYLGWAAMPQLGQWVAAAPFVALFGETFVALRLTTLALSAVGLIAFYDLLRREAMLPPTQAGLATATLAVSPHWFLLSGTFMTDVPALALALAALACYARGLRQGGALWLLAAAVVATVAGLTRQNAIAAPCAAGVVLLWRVRPLSRWPLGLVAVAVPALATVAGHLWVTSRPDVQHLGMALPRPRHFLFLLFVIAHTCGLFGLPAAVGGAAGGLRARAVALLAMAAVVSAAYHFGAPSPPYTNRYPFMGNLVTPRGALGFEGMMVGSPPVVFGDPMRWLLTGLGCLGAALLAGCFDRRGMGALGLLTIFSLLQLPLTATAEGVFDRYLVVFLPGALALLTPTGCGRVRLGPAVAALAVLGGLSLALMHDWLAMNAARWEVGRRAVARGIDPWDIEGGFEWDGYHAPDAATRAATPPPPDDSLTLPRMRGSFPHVRGRYALALEPPPGTTVLDAEPYRVWLWGFRTRQMLLVRR